MTSTYYISTLNATVRREYGVKVSSSDVLAEHAAKYASERYGCFFFYVEAGTRQFVWIDGGSRGSAYSGWRQRAELILDEWVYHTPEQATRIKAVARRHLDLATVLVDLYSERLADAIDAGDRKEAAYYEHLIGKAQAEVNEQAVILGCTRNDAHLNSEVGA